MPAPSTITIIAGRFAVSATVPATAADLKAFDCQVVSAKLTPQPKLNTVAATFCSPESQAPGATGFQIDLTVLQDWALDAAAFSVFAMTHDTEIVYWELALDTGTTPIPDSLVMHGEAYCVAAGFGGDAGVPLDDTITWPVIGRPIQGAWPVTLTACAGDALEAA
jgi:hypothetical protein